MAEQPDFHSALELNDALCELSGACDEACDEAFPLSSGLAQVNASRLLRKLYFVSPHRYVVYPTANCEVAVDASGGPGRSVVLLCESGGGALCLVNGQGVHRRARYITTECPSDFAQTRFRVLEGLKRI